MGHGLSTSTAPPVHRTSAVYWMYLRKHAVFALSASTGFDIDPFIVGDACFEFLADEIVGITNGEPVDFIGFSIGAFVALQTSRFMRSSVQRIHLISAAAPLESGDYLQHMAGKQVFRLAQTFPPGFWLLTYFQGLIARFLPAVLVRMLFARRAAAPRICGQLSTAGN